MKFKNEKNCRICKGDLKTIISLKRVALSGTFLEKKQIKKEKKYLLMLATCLNCKHVQIQNVINRRTLFDHYDWETGISQSNINIINDLLIKLKKRFFLSRKSKVLEVASNDGTLLNKVKKEYRSKVLGIDPAKNLKNISNKKKVSTIVGYFSFLKAKKIKTRHGTFDFCIARNVIAHTPNPNDIFKGVEKILKDNGIFIVEVPYLYNIYKDNQYDNIFHEHIGFHTLKSIRDLCENNFLKIIDTEIIDSQGGSLRCYISKKNFITQTSKNVSSILKKEIKSNLFKMKTWFNFAVNIHNHKNKMNNFLKELKKKNFSISAYGASGKGQALLQFCNINKNFIDFVYDKSKFKQGKYTPGTHIKIIDPRFINIKKPDYLLLLSWNIAKEIIKQEKKYLKGNGKVIVPFPNPKILAN